MQPSFPPSNFKQPNMKRRQPNASYDPLLHPQTPVKLEHCPPQESLATSSKDTPDDYSFFLHSNSYKLDHLNSISYSEGKIFNLLELQSRVQPIRKIKCKCTKSRCESKYCECVAKGRGCGPQCECLNCQNNQPILRSAQHRSLIQKGCKCSKSQCQKNYCECYQKGQACGDKCNCINCKNKKGESFHI